MARKLKLASAVAAAAAITMASAGVASAATNPNTCHNRSSCGTGWTGTKGGSAPYWCDWSGGPASYFLVFHNGVVNPWRYNASGNSGTIQCGEDVGLPTSIHVEVYLTQTVGTINVGFHQ